MAGFSSANAEYMSKRMQVVRHRDMVYPVVGNFEERTLLRAGDTVHRPYKTLPRVHDYTRGTNYNIATPAKTDESLVVDQAKVVPFRIDDLDELQSSFALMNEFADEVMERLERFAIEGAFLAQYSNADHKVDNQEMNSGSSGDGFTLTESNVSAMFVHARRKLTRDGAVKPGKLKAVVSSDVHAALSLRLENKDSELGDEVARNGFLGRYLGFDVHLSDVVAWSGYLAIATNPSNNDTITVNGVVLTFKSSLTASGTDEIKIGATADDTRENIERLFSGTGTAGTDYNNFSDTSYLETTSRGKTLFITATNDGSAGVSFVAKGRGYIPVSSSLTAGADGWTAAKQIQHNLFMEVGSIDIVVQQAPKMRVVPDPNQIADIISPWELYGLKTFTEGKAGLCDARIRTDAFNGTKSTNVL